jgi:hypothetical protein
VRSSSPSRAWFCSISRSISALYAGSMAGGAPGRRFAASTKECTSEYSGVRCRFERLPRVRKPTTQRST